MRKTILFINVFVIFSLVMMLLGLTPMTASASNKAPKADPRLLQMAADHPNDIFMVIVQRNMKNKDLKDDTPEKQTQKGGGKVKKNMQMIESFSAEMTGKEITKLVKNPKVRWISADAPMKPSAGGLDVISDEFTEIAYNGSNGSVGWSTDWIEEGETTNANSDLIQVTNNSACAGGTGNCLRVNPNTPVSSIYREADLSGAVYAELTLYRNNQLNANLGSSEAVDLQISSDEGGTWTTLQTYSSTTDAGASVDSFDIAQYASAHTRIRFLISQSQTGNENAYFDNVQITYARSSDYLGTVGAVKLAGSNPGLDGSGITVAVVDSGINSHPDLMTEGNSRVIASVGFGSLTDTSDQYVHGTYVAGIIAGNGASSDGKFKGMAGGVNIINLKVANDQGMTYESDVLDSLQWIYNNKATYNIRVVNLSLNSSVAAGYNTSPLDAAVEILWFNGIVVVTSAGNNGTGNGSVNIYPPANDPFVITVGATEDKGTSSLVDDNLAFFSAYGVTEDGFSKPDLVAPGRNVVSLLASTLCSAYINHPLSRLSLFPSYFRMSGTSASAPIVSGAVALLLQDEPNLTPDQVKYRLMATANKNWPGYDANTTGAGYLDVYEEVSGATTESANTGILPSQMLSTGSDPIVSTSVGWNTVGWNTVGWNTVGWNTVGWNTVGWNTVGWNTNYEEP